MRLLRRTVGWLKASTLMFIYLIILLVYGTPFLLIALIKVLTPIEGVKKILYKAMVWLWESYVSALSPFINFFLKIEWEIIGDQNFDRNGWYVVMSNHVSAVDIYVLQAYFNRRLPILKFFIKNELKKLPIIGWCCVAMEFPFMQRPSKAAVEKNPKLKNIDLETTRIACEKFKEVPTSIMNFVEGTRFTLKKQLHQQSPYNNLLVPHAGGIALALSILGKEVRAILDVTLLYEGGSRFKDFITGKMRKIVIKIEALPVDNALHGDYTNDMEYRKYIRNWINHRWQLKDGWLISYKKHQK